MGKKRGKAKLDSVSHMPLSLREEATGNLQIKAGTKVKCMLKVEHLKRLARWATQEAHIPSLGAFYGQRLATVAEAAGASHDPSLITCQRCETILHPGFNCTVRVEKNRSKARRKHNKSVNNTQNNVVYKCHYCLHQNLKRGTPKGLIKEICPSKNKTSLESMNPTTSISHKSSKLEKNVLCEDKARKADVLASQVVATDVAVVDSPATPSSVSITPMLEGKKRRRNSSNSKMGVETASKSAKVEASKTQSTSKRRKRSWTSLKEIAQNNEHETSHVAKLTIPFFL